MEDTQSSTGGVGVAALPSSQAGGSPPTSSTLPAAAASGVATATSTASPSPATLKGSASGLASGVSPAAAAPSAGTTRIPVRLIGFETFTVNGEKFTIFIVECIREGVTLTAKKRYSEFKKMHSELKATFTKLSLPSFPQKKYMGKFDSDFLNKRMMALQGWCNRMVALIEAVGDKELENAFFAFFEDKAQAEEEKHSTSGYGLSLPQEKALKEVRSELPAHLKDAHNIRILPFLRETNFEPREALRRFVEDETWRRAMGIEHYTCETVRRAFLARKLFLCDTKDKQGRPILIYRTARISKDEQLLSPTGCTTVEMAQLYIYLLEHMIASMTPPARTFVLLLDMKEQHITQRDLRLCKLFLDILQNYYYGRLAAIYVLNGAWYCKMAWSVLRPWIKDNFAREVKILDNPQHLSTYVDMNQIPRELSGDFDFDAEAWLAAKAAIEGSNSPELPQEQNNISMINKTVLATLSEIAASECAEGSIKTGYLSKEGGIVRNYKKRFFVLKDNLLFYYKTDKDTMPRGAIVLDNSVLRENDANPNSFLLVTYRRTYVLFATSEKHKREWMEAIAQQTVMGPSVVVPYPPAAPAPFSTKDSARNRYDGKKK
ncbi:FYVE, RhoGEF and PH domain-containing protein 6 [Balamuthia mandrillaris]